MAVAAETTVLVSLWSPRARQSLHSLLGHFHGRKRVFLTQVDCSLFLRSGTVAFDSTKAEKGTLWLL